MLGCDIGYGYLHRIPTKSKSSDPEKVPEVNNDTTVESGASKFAEVSENDSGVVEFQSTLHIFSIRMCVCRSL